MRYRRVLHRGNRRRLEAIGSQALSSLSNVLAALLVARSFDALEPFGAFGIAMVAYQLMVELTRALIGEPFLSLYSDAPSADRTRVMRDGVAFTALVALAGSGLILVAGLTVGGLPGQALVGLSAILPLVLLHDAYRYYTIIDRANIALLIDAVWLIGVVLGFQLIPAGSGIVWYVIAWGGAAGCGLVVAILSVPGLMTLTNPWQWMRFHRDACRNTLGEYLTVGVTNRLMVLLLAPIGGLATVGAERASQVFYGPHFTLHAGIYLVVVPEGVRLRKDPQKLARSLTLCSLILALLALIWMLVGLVMPGAWGEALLGGSWEGARELMVPFGIGMAATALSSGGRLGLRSLGDLHGSFIARLQVTPWQLVLPLAGALWWGVSGFGFGFALSRVITAALWWRGFNGSLRQNPPGDPGDPGDNHHGEVPNETSSLVVTETTRDR